MAPDPLNPASILAQMAEALPTHKNDDPTSDLSSSLDVVALFAHACMVSLEFRLLGFNEDQNIEAECSELAPRLPPQWNKDLSSHSFVYSHTQSSMRFVIRVDRLGGKIEIRGLAVGDERIHRFEIVARDYISSAALPVRIGFSSPTADGAEPAEIRGDALVTKLSTLFTSPSYAPTLAGLTSQFKREIIQRLIPSLQKPGYEEQRNPDDRAAQQDADTAGRRAGAFRPPDFPQVPLLQPAPVVPQPQPYPLPRNTGPTPTGDFPPPGFDDEYDLNRPPRGPINPYLGGGLGMGPGGRPSASPFGIGGSDLYPAGLGPDDPIRGSFVPGRQPGFGPSGGMHPTFDDPLFQGPRGTGDGNGQFDPQVPPGARWDPLGPGGAPRFGGGRPGGRGGGAFGGGYGGDII